MSSEGVQATIAVPEVGFVYLVGEIDEELTAKVVVGIAQSIRMGQSVKLAISSEGGKLFNGMAMADAITSARAAGVAVEGEVLGLCASAASLLLMACTVRTMQKESWLAIHGMSDHLMGDNKDIEAGHAFNQRLIAQQAKWFAGHSKHPEEYWMPILKDKTAKYYSAEEALEAGLIDGIS